MGRAFGAIDIPAPGGTATGTNHRNQGWVLTPPPNRVPETGTTINVYVDGVYLGHPVYNIYRPNIAALFPGYINSNGAGAYFDIDTTVYENGIHSIYWTGGRRPHPKKVLRTIFRRTYWCAGDSRNYIYPIELRCGCMTGGYSNLISPLEHRGLAHNSVSRKMAIGPSWVPHAMGPRRGAVEDADPITLFTGYTETPGPQEIYPGAQGIIEIEIHELERVEIHWQEYREPDGNTEHAESTGLPQWLGFQVIGDRLRPLPVGSSLDSERGIFYWQPGPGFYGDYDLAFIKLNDTERKVSRIRIRILPKSPGD